MPGVTMSGSVVVVVGASVVVVLVLDVVLVVVLDVVAGLVEPADPPSELLHATMPTASANSRPTRRANERWTTGGVLMAPTACPVDGRNSSHASSRGVLSADVMPADVMPADVIMVSDLFVDPAHRARGVGRRLLGAALDGRGRAMTFSSSHPAALRLYASSGLRAGSRLLTMRGTARGGGPPLTPAMWRHSRPELVAYLAAAGATVCEDAVVRLHDDAATVWRTTGSEPQRVLEEVLRGLPSGCVVELSVMETHPTASWLVAQGFAVIDHDIWCATPGVLFPAEVCCVLRGLL
jgi:GNAT superfamily N-acetyltransferase